MKTLGIVLTVLLLVVACFYVTAEATTDRTVTVGASGSVTAVTSLTVAPATISYTTTTVDSYSAVPKILITYSSNYNPWNIMVYTNNTQVPMWTLTTGSYSKGGLATSTGSAVVACKWVAKTGSNTVTPAVPAYNAYNFVKDKRDEDDPATTTQNESWGTAFTQGYPNIAFGDTTGGFCVDPTNSAVGPNQYKGDPITGGVGIALYVAALWGTGGVSPAVPAGAGSYSTTFTVELYHP